LWLHRLHIFVLCHFGVTPKLLYVIKSPGLRIENMHHCVKIVYQNPSGTFYSFNMVWRHTHLFLKLPAYVFGYESGELFYHDRWSHNSAYWKTSADLDERYLKRTAGPCSCATEKMHELSVEFPDQRYSELITNLGDATFMFPENLDRDQDRESYRIRGWQEVEVNRQTCMVRWQMPLEGRDRSGDFVGRCSGGSIIGRVYVPIRMGRDVGPPEVGNWIMK